MSVVSLTAGLLAPQDLTIFKGLDCTPDEVFVPATYTLADLSRNLPDSLVASASQLADKLLPPPVLATLSNLTFTFAPIQLHALSFALFASFAAPFGAPRLSPGPGIE